MSTETKHTVLVVDDEPEVVESLRRTLRHEKFKFVGTTSPLEALGIVLQGDVDLVIADIDMPEMNGLSLVSKIRAQCPDVVRILLTGDASLESAMTAINLGEVHRYLVKPWQKDELRETLRTALDRLDELRRASRASHAVAAHKELVAALESEHPGIWTVEREDGAYVLDAERIAKTLSSLTEEPLRNLFDVEATFGPREHVTRRSGP